jgi:hypothetical protein
MGIGGKWLRRAAAGLATAGLMTVAAAFDGVVAGTKDPQLAGAAALTASS